MEMETRNNLLFELKYPYLTQLVGLSGWLSFTPIILTTNSNFERKALVDLRSESRHLRIIHKDGRLIKDEGKCRVVKEEWRYYWDKKIYEECKYNWQNQVYELSGKFHPLLKMALIDDLCGEKLCGYIFREPILYFSPSDVIPLKPN